METTAAVREHLNMKGYQIDVGLLALLDYVSRAHEIESSVVRPSVRRQSVASITSEVIAWIAVVASPGPYAQTCFFLGFFLLFFFSF